MHKSLPDIPEEQLLSRHGIRPTSVRILALRALLSFSDTFSLGDMAEALPECDESSLFRTLRRFSKAGLVHEVDDGSGSMKYCLCHCDDDTHHHRHIHFHCLACQRTICIKDVPVPDIHLPEGFVVDEGEYVLKGFCPECRR